MPVMELIGWGPGVVGYWQDGCPFQVVHVPSSGPNVWHAEATDAWSSATCGARIEQYKREGRTDEEARAQVGLFYTACEPCWPWPKYKASSDERISAKRGVAQQNFRLNAPSLSTLSQRFSWGYTWHHQPMDWEGGPSLAEWERRLGAKGRAVGRRHGLNFIPMVWGEGESRLDLAIKDGLPQNKRALLGFNEPNFPEQANLSPARAASLWPTEFFGNCTGCRVDAVAFHSYTCYGRYLKDHIEMYKVFKRPLWLTEFACSEAGSLERLNAFGQMAYMREAVPLLESDESIEMYAWFNMFEDDWLHPIVDGKNGDAGLIYSNGTLTPLGELYSSFTGPTLYSPPPVAATTTTTTPPACRTAQAGEECYDSIIWAMTQGILEHPDWYPGLSQESSFHEVQRFLWEKVHDSTGHCHEPCPPDCTSTGNCEAMGVNVFGFDGFDNADAVKRAVRVLFQKGVRHFRVVNVGAWASDALLAIEEMAKLEAERSGRPSAASVQITSLFFDSPSSCASLPSWMDFSLSMTLEKLKQLVHVSRILLQLDTYSELYCINPTEQGFGQSLGDQARAKTFKNFIEQRYGSLIQEAHRAFPKHVEFVISFQNEGASPLAMLEPLLWEYIQPLRAEGRKFYVEGTLYPFWILGLADCPSSGCCPRDRPPMASSTQIFAPFDSSAVERLMAFASQLTIDGFIVSETGWPQACPLNSLHRPASLQNMCRYWQNTVEEVQKLAEDWGEGPARREIWRPSGQVYEPSCRSCTKWQVPRKP
eukprot:g32718.t1